jgi:FkbM family methyltransferase
MIYASPLANLIRGSLNAAVPKGLSENLIAAGGLRGMTLLLDMQTEKDFWLGTYEPELQAELKDLIHPGMITYDVGANIGYITLLFARLLNGKGKIFSFEALPDNVDRLKKNIALNHVDSLVTVIDRAVTDSVRPLKFFVHASGGMGKAEGSAGRAETYQREINVQGISLDAFVYDQHHSAPDVIKMDIEGGEVLALPGMKRLLAEKHPIMLMELHGPESAQAAWDALTAAGYSLYMMKPDHPQVNALDQLDWKAYLIGRQK